MSVPALASTGSQIFQYPDVVMSDEMLSPDELIDLKDYIEGKSSTAEMVQGGRVVIIHPQAKCRIESADSFAVRFFEESNIEVEKILEKLFQKAMQAAYKLDGEKVVGSAYLGQMVIARYIFPSNYPKSGLLLHHDHDYKDKTSGKRYYYLSDGLPNAFPTYLFLGMLSNQNGGRGWEGGNLIIQNHNGPEPYVTLDETHPYLEYDYVENSGICMRNKEVVHQVTSIGQLRGSTGIARDLLVVQLFDELITQKSE